ncbi:MAG: Inositol 2-dehydrogenase/D-chiro-inositol 3-dehydrogenase [Ignavibacteria bacterium]|nr:Inositol 2-dehydrogenase/D-chiro-inositol 3-dehydrogenase [Ignavibacteria bacterium]
MKKIKAGIFGLGHLGKTHLKLVKELCNERSDIELIGIFDTDESKNKNISDELGLKINKKAEELTDKINTAIIVTPTSTHYELATMMISKSINTFIEKPVTETTTQAEELLKSAVDKKIKIQIGHIERFNPAILALDSIDLKPMFIETHRLAQFNPRGTDVSVIQDLMIHDIDIILNLVKSKVSKIDASGVPVITDKIDIANARIKFDNGCVANITASRISQNKMRKMRMFQKSAYISVDFLQNSSEVFRLSDGETLNLNGSNAFALAEFMQGEKKLKILYEKPEVKEVNSMKYELNKFFNAITDDTEPVVTLGDGLQALEVANEIINEIESSKKI